MTDDSSQQPATAYPSVDRRGEPDRNDWRAHVDKRLDAGAETMKAMRKEMAENTETTKKVQADTSELVELLKSFKGAFKVLEGLGKLAKPMGYIAAAVAAFLGLWAAIKGGGLPR